MPTCEICGRESQSTREIVLEGARLQACNRCSKLGEPVHRPKPAGITRTVSHKPRAASSRRSSVIPRSPQTRAYRPELVPVENFSTLIRKARERSGMSQKEVAQKLNERSSVITKVESGKMPPTISLARKLERLFKLTLLEEAESVDLSPGTSKSTTTFGDVVQVRRKKSSP